MLNGGKQHSRSSITVIMWRWREHDFIFFIQFDPEHRQNGRLQTFEKWYIGTSQHLNNKYLLKKLNNS